MLINKSSNIFFIALILALVCSSFVSFPAVFFRSRIELNQKLEEKKNIIEAAGLYKEEIDISLVFESRIEKRFISLETGLFLDSKDFVGFDPIQASKDATKSFVPLHDIAGLVRVSKVAIIYLVKSEDLSSFEKIVFPIRGKGLWSTLYGFLALKMDFNTVDGLTFYQHGETPGLGGEIDNPIWKKQWIGKKIYDTNFEVALKVIRGSVDSVSVNRDYQIDGLSGATITSRGVTNLIHFWFSKYTYGLFLEYLRTKQISF